MQWCRNVANGRSIANGSFQNALSHISDAQYGSVKDNGEYETKPVAPLSGFYAGKHTMSMPSSLLYYIIVDWKIFLL